MNAMWNVLRKLLLALACAGLPTGAWAQNAPAAGRFVLAVGAVQVQRGGSLLQARPGFEVRSGDTIRTAPASSAQVWMTDGSMLAVRERSEFRLDSYRYAPKGGGSSQVTSIVKGGARMLTGAIGKANPAAVKVNTRVALIGIRGTGFDLVDCADQCIDGQQPADPGLYGTVFEGQISVTNENGADGILTGKTFYVASKSAPVVLLDHQPTFLAEPVNMVGAGEPTADVPPPDVPASVPDVPVASQLPRIESPYVMAKVQMPPPAQADALTIPATSFSGAAQGNGGTLASAGVATISLLSAEYNPVTGDRNVANTLSPVSVAYQGSVITGIRYPRVPSFPGYVIGGYTAKLIEGGTDSGVVSWGRWADGSVLIGGWSGTTASPTPLTLEKNQGFHWIVGDVTRIAVPQGIYNFSLIGATTPTETRANAAGGWLVTKGSLVADLNAAKLSGSLQLFVSQAAGYGYFGLDFTGSLAGGITSTPVALDVGVNKLTGSINLCTATCAGTGKLEFFGNDPAKPASHAGMTYDFNPGQGFVVQGAAVFGR
ncbi:MAG: hypothetical protein RLZZ427_778 [Pseudomonadota bacterium]